MPRTFMVDLKTTLEATVTVTLSDERLQEIAAEQGVSSVDALTLDVLAEYLQEDALCDVPSDLCVSCSGWGSHGKYSTSIGEWEVVEDEPKYKYSAVRDK